MTIEETYLLLHELGGEATQAQLIELSHERYPRRTDSLVRMGLRRLFTSGIISQTTLDAVPGQGRRPIIWEIVDQAFLKQCQRHSYIENGEIVVRDDHVSSNTLRGDK